MLSEDSKNQSTHNSINFRQEAIDHLTDIHSNYQLVRLHQMAEWVILTALGILIVFGIFWGIFGTVSTWVEGRGILLPSEQNLYTSTLQEGSAELENYLVKVGDTVTEGQPIANLGNELLKDQITTNKAYIEKLEEKYKKEKAESEKEIIENAQQIDSQKKSLLESEKTAQNHLNMLMETSSKINNIQDQKLIPIQRIEQVSIYIKDAQETINNIKRQLIQKDVEREEFLYKWELRLRDLELKIKDAKNEHEKLRYQEKASLTLESPVNGKVVTLNKTKGDLVQKGDSVAIISTYENNIDAVIFLPPQEGKKVKVGMTALVTPSTVKREEFGGIYAEITYVSSLPITAERMKAIVQNDKLSKVFNLNDEPAIEVRARLKIDPKTYSGFAWSSSSGPQEKINIGVIINTRVSVREQSPFSLIIPAIRKLKGE